VTVVLNIWFFIDFTAIVWQMRDNPIFLNYQK